jgi:hypothetical protein
MAKQAHHLDGGIEDDPGGSAMTIRAINRAISIAFSARLGPCKKGAAFAAPFVKAD